MMLAATLEQVRQQQMTHTPDYSLCQRFASCDLSGECEIPSRCEAGLETKRINISSGEDACVDYA